MSTFSPIHHTRAGSVHFVHFRFFANGLPYLFVSEAVTDVASKIQRPFTVLRVVLDSGERLPCLVESATWLPVRVATRWAVRHRRYRVQSSTLVSNLRALSRLYTWAQRTAGFDLDDFLIAGKTLDSRQVESLASDLRSNTDGLPADTGAFDHRLSVVEDFLRWSLDSSNRGGGHPLTLSRLSAEQGRLRDIFRSLRIGGRPATRIQPLEESQVKAIRAAIGPQGSSEGGWSFPDVFAPHARLRNWLMFETALELGIRRGNCSSFVSILCPEEPTTACSFFDGLTIRTIPGHTSQR